jgi:hypothetical protein
VLREFSKELAEDRSFEFGGHVFKFRYPHWEEGAAIWDAETEAIGSNGDFSWKADTEFAIERIPIFLDPENNAHAEFKKIVKRKENPVPRQQIAQLYTWLVRMTSGLPTNPPSASEPGGGSSDDSSAGESS